MEPVLPLPSPLFVPCLPDDLIQLTAMCWMREFIQLAGRVMLPYSSGILTAVLPCLSYDDRKKSILAVRAAAIPSLLQQPTGKCLFQCLFPALGVQVQERFSHQVLTHTLPLWMRGGLQ